MTIAEALLSGAKKLKAKNISSARLDAEVLLGFTLKRPREFLLSHTEKTLKQNEQKMYSTLISRRAKYEPVAYLTGEKEFYGLILRVDRRVLIPRPETELLVDEALALAGASGGSKMAIFDVGTGSGSIACALAKNLPKAKIWALEASPDALNLAKINAKALRLEIRAIKSNLLKNVKSEFLADAIIVANLPYLDKAEIKNFPEEIKRGLSYEPQGALFAAKHGTALYEKLFKQVAELPAQPRVLIAEIGSYHWRDFLKLAKKHFPDASISVKKDLAKRPRMLVISF